MEQILESWFPNLAKYSYSLESPQTIDYNCIAWAANDTERCWWPDPLDNYYWPPGIPRIETKEAFVLAFELLGYKICDTPDHENGYEKVAIYTDLNGEPTHAARQLDSGNWTSKMGDYEDIEHENLDSVAGSEYGTPVVILRRPK